jgi:hypothetical protein
LPTVKDDPGSVAGFVMSAENSMEGPNALDRLFCSELC